MMAFLYSFRFMKQLARIDRACNIQLSERSRWKASKLQQRQRAAEKPFNTEKAVNETLYTL